MHGFCAFWENSYTNQGKAVENKHDRPNSPRHCLIEEYQKPKGEHDGKNSTDNESQVEKNRSGVWHYTKIAECVICPAELWRVGNCQEYAAECYKWRDYPASSGYLEPCDCFVAHFMVPQRRI